MPKKSTSIKIDEELWKEFVMFVVKKHGSTRKIGYELEKAIKEYLEKHKNEVELP